MKQIFKIDELVKATNGELISKGDVSSVSNVSIDSREVGAGECFLALKGPHFDGEDFVGDAIKKGATLIITHQRCSVPEGSSCILVKDSVKALGDIASILRWNDEHKAAVLEMGMNAPGEITRLAKIAKPHVGIITNVSPAHLELLHTIENVAKAKGELFDNMRDDGTIIVNLEDPWIKKLAKGYKGETYTFGMQNNADVRFGRLDSRGLDSTDMIIYIEGKEYSVHLKVPGTHNVMNAMAALSIARVLGVSAEDAISGLEEFEPMAMRMERTILSNGVQLVNDSYTANPNSVKEALRTISGAKKAGRFVAVLGDMLELGKDAPSCHFEVGKAAAKHHVDMLYTFGDHSEDIAEGARSGGIDVGKVEQVLEMDDLKKKVLDFIKTGDIVLVKGSRGMKMERVVDYLIDEIGVE